MDRSNRLAHYIGIFVLVLWGTVMAYFYASGRITSYLTSDSIFREQALIAGLGLLVLAAFNLVTGTAKIDGHDDCCGHGNGDHDHAHDHHGHDDGHDHHHHGEHDHHHEGHEEAPAHEHHHDHAHDHESTFGGGIVAALILVVPLGAAAILTPDAFSAQAITNKLALATNASSVGVAPEGTALSRPAGSDSASDPAEGADGGSAPTYAFTIEDLNRMVERSEDGAYLISPVEALLHRRRCRDPVRSRRLADPIDRTDSSRPEIGRGRHRQPLTALPALYRVLRSRRPTDLGAYRIRRRTPRVQRDGVVSSEWHHPLRQERRHHESSRRRGKNRSDRAA